MQPAQNLVVGISSAFILDQKTAVVAANLDLVKFQKTIEEVSTPISFAFTVTDKGSILTHPNKSFIMKDLEEIYPELTLEVLESLQGESDVEPLEMDVRGVFTLVSAETSSSTGWHVVFLTDESKVYERSYDSIYASIITIFSSVFISSILVVFAIKHILEPLVESNRELGKLASGDGDLTFRLPKKQMTKLVS